MTNNDIKKIQSLARKKFRQDYSQFYIEGRRLVQSAIDMNANVEVVYVTDPFLKKNGNFAEKLQKSGLTMKQISSKVMDKLSFTKSPAGIAAVCSLPKKVEFDFFQTRWLYLDQISDPGNIGTLFRSAAWFGFHHIALSKECVDPFNPKVVRAGMGSHFGLTIHTDVSLDIFSNSHILVGADHRGISVADYEVPEKFILVLGSEAHGLSESVRDKLHEMVAIEKRGFGESLNVSVAGAILMEKMASN